MVVDHWFRQVSKILKAMEITSNSTKIKLAAFQVEGESQVWWDWVNASRNLEATTSWVNTSQRLPDMQKLGSS